MPLLFDPKFMFAGIIGLTVLFGQSCDLVPGPIKSILGVKDKKSGGGGGESSELPEQVNVSGTLAVDTNSQINDQNAANNRQVELVNNDGAVVAKGTSDSSGAFTLQVTTNEINLVGNTTSTPKSTMPKFVNVRSLFLVETATSLVGQKDAVGVKDSIILDNKYMRPGSNGIPSLNTGTHAVKKVGAIVGKVVLETSEDPVGVEIYVPGTTHIAKTDSNGQFVLGFLPAGSYKLRADKTGFNSVEWDNVIVKRNETSHLDKSTLQIARGPQIEKFVLESLSDQTGIATIRVRLKSASKYRISKLGDFSDAVYKPFSADSPEFLVTVELPAGVKLANVYIEAADSNGLTAKKSIVIDREAPTGGKISVNSSNGLVNSIQVPLILAGTGATKMKITESVADLSTAGWIDYATTYTYTLKATADGEKTLYASFSDEAKNILGGGGEISTTFTLDTVPPADGKITLLQPESPTGAFNTPLAWNADYDESGITYVIEVVADSSFNPILRTMQTANQLVQVNPALTSEGTYFWRVKAIDAAGNASSWVSSSTADKNTFTLKILAEAYHSEVDYLGDSSSDKLFARKMLVVDDLNGDGTREIVYSIINTQHADSSSSCSDCSVVKVFDPGAGAVIATLSEFLPKAAYYGHEIITCDLTGDNRKEIIVAAPRQAVVYNGKTYNNAGAIYVYDSTTFDLMASIAATLTGATTPANGYSDCDVSVGGICEAYGYKTWPWEVPETLEWSQGYFLGWGLACLEKSGADSLFAAQPGYHNGTSKIGRVTEYQYSSGSLTAVANIDGSGTPNMFGYSVAALTSFKFSTCSTVETIIAIGNPYKIVNASARGSVSLYRYDGTNWTSCATIDAANDDITNGMYGARLFNLGDIDKDGSVQELAVASYTWGGGAVRVYGGSSAAILKSYRTTSSDFDKIGFQVGAAGDFNADGNSELFITVPQAKVSGKWSAGSVLIYQWSQLDDDDDNSDGDSDGSAYLTMTGIPSGNAFLGADFQPVWSSSDVHTAPAKLYISSPGRNINNTWQVGSFHNIAKIKMAPGLPTRMEGQSTNAAMGSSVFQTDDLDNDTISDIMISQTGGRCRGYPYGALSVYSVLDGIISQEICSQYNNDKIGRFSMFAPNSDYILFSVGTQLYMVSKWNAVAYTDISNTTNYPSTRKSSDSASWNFPWFSETYTKDSSTDEVMIGDGSYWNTAANQGRVYMYTVDSQFTKQCLYSGDTLDSYFGRSAAFVEDLNADGIRDILIGSPGQKRVYVVNGVRAGAGNCNGETDIVINSGAAKTLFTINFDDAVITNAIGENAQTDFGAFVAGLPDLDGAGSAKAYIYVANTNIKQKSSSVVPQYFIFKYDGSTLSFVRSETGDGGSMLGGYAKVISDVNGDGKAELAISHPGGAGRLGNYGQVKIISGSALTTSDTADDIIQALFNPDPVSSNFGVSIEYGDFNGDGLYDFIVGANEHDSAYFGNAGAVYTYQMNPIKK